MIVNSNNHNNEKRYKSSDLRAKINGEYIK